MPFLLILQHQNQIVDDDARLNNTLQQNKSGTCPAHQPNDSPQAGNQSVVEYNKEDTAKSHSDSIELQPLIPDKDYPAGVREWMMTAPSELKFSTLAVSSSMLAVYATRIRLNYVYDNSLSAILLHVLVCGDQSSGKSFARYLMRYLMDPFIKRDTEQRAEEQKYAELKRRQGKKMANCLRSQRQTSPCSTRIFRSLCSSREPMLQ